MTDLLNLILFCLCTVTREEGKRGRERRRHKVAQRDFKERGRKPKIVRRLKVNKIDPGDKKKSSMHKPLKKQQNK